MKEVVDLFEEEMLKEDKKEMKKIEKEKSRQKRYEKKLEKMEDEEFAKMLKEDKKVKDDDFEEIVKEEKNNEVEEVKEEKKHSFLNFLLGLSIIVLFLASSDYAVYNIIKGKELEQILTASALCVTSIFYILSIIVKKTVPKKLFEILATLSIAAYMCYYLFIA